MPEIFRTPEERFANLKGYPFAPNYLEWEGLRMHYVDEGPKDGQPILLVHGMPTWSYLYRTMIPTLVDAGFRCIAPDYIGFGKSDKVLDDSWYSIKTHARSIKHLVDTLDLRNAILVCQDWGGPIGLSQVADQPERFSRLCIMNTWLHHEGFEYSDFIRDWQNGWKPGGAWLEQQGCGAVLKFQSDSFPGSPLTPEEAFDAYEAPFPDAASKAGPRRFPLSIPIDDPSNENTQFLQSIYDRVIGWTGPINFLWGTLDTVFTEAWGEEWSSRYPQATLDKFPAFHFLQETHGPEIARRMVERIAA